MVRGPGSCRDLALNAIQRHIPSGPIPPGFDVLDILLADLAARIQLPASLHAKAVERYGVIRDGSIGQAAPSRGAYGSCIRRAAWRPTRRLPATASRTSSTSTS